jgi:hypothetical protein
VDGLSSTEGAVALAAAAVALGALGLATFLAFRMRALRAAQNAVLGDYGQRDLIEHAATLQRTFVELRDWVDDTSRGVEGRLATAEGRIDGCVSHCAVVRYDAYGEMSGRQSTSVALLDSRRSGVVLSSILHRDSERTYVKQVVAGHPEHELSPEEQDAVDKALRGAPAESA